MYVSPVDSDGKVYIVAWNVGGGICGKNEGTVANAYVKNVKFIMPKDGGVFVFPNYPNSNGTIFWDEDDLWFHPITAGQVNGTTENSFFATVSGAMPETSFKDGKNGTEKSSEEMHDKTTYTDAGWDFSDIWLVDPVTKLPVFEFTANPSTEPDTDPVTEPETDPVTEPETDPVTEPETDPVTVPVTTEPESSTDDSNDSGCNKIFKFFRDFWNKLVKIFLDLFGKFFGGSFGGSNGNCGG